MGQERRFIDQALLDGDWKQLGLESHALARAEALHAGLRELRMHEARVDLALADGLSLFDKGGLSFAVLGYSNRSDACEMELGFSWSHARELIAIRNALPGLPALRAAFLAGEIGRGKLRILVRIATPETERGWLAWSRSRSARTLERDVARFREGRLDATALDQAAAREDELRARAADSQAADSSETDWTWLKLTGTDEERARWRYHGWEMVRLVTGERLPQWQALEYVVANVMAGAEAPAGEPATCVHGGPAGDAQGGCIRRDDLERHCVHARPRRRRRGPDPAALKELGARLRVPDSASPIDIPDPLRATCSESATGALKVLSQVRERIAYERGRLLGWMDHHEGWRLLGARTLAHYALHALDMSQQELRMTLDLDRRLASLPHLDQAWRTGRMTQRVASLTARVARPQTDGIWTRYVQEITLKRLEAEVYWHQERSKLLPRDAYEKISRGGLPCDDRLMSDLWSDPLETFGEHGRLRALGPETAAVVRATPLERLTAPPAKDDTGDEATACTEGPDAQVLSFLRTWFRPGRFGIRVPAHLVPMVRAAVSAVRPRLGPGATDAACLLAAVEELVRDNVDPEKVKRVGKVWWKRAVLERDRWRCASALCRSRRCLEVHHVELRSQGGEDDPDNCLTLCGRCHRLLHDGYMRIGGCATDGFVQYVRGKAWSDGVRLRELAA